MLFVAVVEIRVLKVFATTRATVEAKVRNKQTNLKLFKKLSYYHTKDPRIQNCS